MIRQRSNQRLWDSNALRMLCLAGVVIAVLIFFRLQSHFQLSKNLSSAELSLSKNIDTHQCVILLELNTVKQTCGHRRLQEEGIAALGGFTMLGALSAPIIVGAFTFDTFGKSLLFGYGMFALFILFAVIGLRTGNLYVSMLAPLTLGIGMIGLVHFDEVMITDASNVTDTVLAGIGFTMIFTVVLVFILRFILPGMSSSYRLYTVAALASIGGMIVTGAVATEAFKLDGVSLDLYSTGAFLWLMGISSTVLVLAFLGALLKKFLPTKNGRGMSTAIQAITLVGGFTTSCFTIAMVEKAGDEIPAELTYGLCASIVLTFFLLTVCGISYAKKLCFQGENMTDVTKTFIILGTGSLVLAGLIGGGQSLPTNGSESTAGGWIAFAVFGYIGLMIFICMFTRKFCFASRASNLRFCIGFNLLALGSVTSICTIIGHADNESMFAGHADNLTASLFVLAPIMLTYLAYLMVRWFNGGWEREANGKIKGLGGAVIGLTLFGTITCSILAIDGCLDKVLFAEGASAGFVWVGLASFALVSLLVVILARNKGCFSSFSFFEKVV